MAGTMVGADGEAVLRLARAVEAGAAQLDMLRREVRARLHSAPWQGRDAADFRREWDNGHAPVLGRLAAELRVVSSRLLHEAEQQQVASQSHGTGWRVGAFGLAGDGDPSSWPPGVAELPYVLAPGTAMGNDVIRQLRGVTVDLDELALKYGIGSTVERGIGIGRQSAVELGPLGLTGQAELFAGEQRSMSVKAVLNTEGVAVGAEASMSGGVSAAASGVATVGIASVAGTASAFLGARAGAAAGLRADRRGASAHAGGRAFVGAAVSAQGTAELAGVTAGLGVTGYAGAGVVADVDAVISAERVTVDIELGAALGLGVGVRPSLTFSPAEAASDFTNLLGWGR